MVFSWVDIGERVLTEFLAWHETSQNKAEQEIKHNNSLLFSYLDIYTLKNFWNKKRDIYRNDNNDNDILYKQRDAAYLKKKKKNTNISIINRSI